MRCQSCDLELAPADNYCRRCGAGVQVPDLPTVAHAAPPVPVSPGGEAIVDMARPLLAGAAVVTAGALLRFTLRFALRAMAGEARRRGPTGRVGRATAGARDGAIIEVTEIYHYRRIVR